MSEFRSLFRVELGPHHLRPGRTKLQLKDTAGLHEFPLFIALEVCSMSPAEGFYLMYEPETGHGTDTWHQTLDDAFHQAEWEFGVTREEWKKTDRPYS
jgi:hypothetical protein